MNNKQSHIRLQALTPEAMVHIADLAERDNEGLAQRCASYRRRASIRRTAVAACIFIGCCLSYSSSMATPLYDQITTSSKAGNQHICDTIRLAIEKK